MCDPLSELTNRMCKFTMVYNYFCITFLVKEDDGPYYTHLGAGGSFEELRELLEDR